MSTFHQLSDGKSGNGWGKAPPRVEFIAHAGIVELTRKVANVPNATIADARLDKKRNQRLFMPTSAMRN
jgi:hypothetical protein